MKATQKLADSPGGSVTAACTLSCECLQQLPGVHYFRVFWVAIFFCAFVMSVTFSIPGRNSSPLPALAALGGSLYQP